MRIIRCSFNYAIGCLFFLSAVVANAQMATKINQADYDARPIKFGYFVGLPFTHYNLEFNNFHLTSKDSIYSVSSANTIGLKMGGLMNINVNEYFDVKIAPTVAIYTRKIEFNYPNRVDAYNDNTSAWFEIPVSLKYKSERRKNTRMYVFTGLCLGLQTNPTINGKGIKQKLYVNATDLSLQYGVGIEFFKEYFKFTPELHFSHGISNLIDTSKQQNTSLAGLSNLTTHTVTLYFLFE